MTSRAIRIALEARRSPWAAPLTLWVASRILSTALLALMFGIATAAGWTFASHRADPSFLTFSGSWDASYYRTIAEHGYPTHLPRSAGGDVLPNAWAFLPVFPAVVRGVMLTGASFWLAGVIVAGLCGAGAAVVLYRLVAATGCSARARRATALFVFGPMGFVLQVSYAESMFLLLLFGALLALARQRYWLVGVLGVVAAFTRPGVVALAVALAVELVVRWVRAHRGGPAFGWGRRVGVTVAGVVVAAAGLAWPVIAGAATGVPNAYVDTELSWWTGYVGYAAFRPLTPWFLFAGRWLGIAGILLVIAVLAGAAWFFARADVRRIGLGSWAFVSAYALYLVAVFLPQQSLPRLMLPMAPAFGSDVFVGSRRRTLVWLVVGMALQPAAIVFLWFLGYP